MLTFNLAKPDRIILHKRIAALKISPQELSLMSSTDLADEETQQSIKIAEKEALEHSILIKTVAPRAKITHKGMVDIEDVNTEGATMREREREREREEEERRGREKAARQRAAQMQRRPSLNQGSAPPESPVTPIQSSAGWGRPPALPLHAVRTGEGNNLGPARSPVDATFSQSPTDAHSFSEPQLDLAELINIDDDPTSQDFASPKPPLVIQSTEGTAVPSSSAMSPSPATQTGISPFAAGGSKPEPVTRSSFDLSSLWTAPTGDKLLFQSESPPPSSIDEPKGGLADDHVDIDGQEADDQDFDMFLEGDRDKPTEPVDISPEAQQAQLMTQPHVWSGRVGNFDCSSDI